LNRCSTKLALIGFPDCGLPEYKGIVSLVIASLEKALELTSDTVSKRNGMAGALGLRRSNFASDVALPNPDSPGYPIHVPPPEPATLAKAQTTHRCRQIPHLQHRVEVVFVLDAQDGL